MSPRRRDRGFTLLEALLALAIVAVIGVAAYQLLDSTARLKSGGEVRYRALGELQRGVRLLEEDFAHAVVVPGAGNDAEDPAALDSAPAEGVFALTRTGWRNPLALPRSRLQRVSWDVDEDGRLLRRAWPGVETGKAEDAQLRVVAEGVESLELRFLDASGDWQDAWPPEDARVATAAETAGAAPQPAAALPVAVELRLVQQQLGEVIRVVPLR